MSEMRWYKILSADKERVLAHVRATTLKDAKKLAALVYPDREVRAA